MPDDTDPRVQARIDAIWTAMSPDERFAAMASMPEDVILNKLRWWRRAGGSDRQWGDILGLLRVQAKSLDVAYLQHWAAQLEQAADLERALHQARGDVSSP